MSDSSSERVKISVVTISFNQAEYLPACIESVISQRGVDIEYIVLDPGSTDGSREIIDRYRKHFKHIIFDPDSGPADGLNKGLALASGELFYYLNSDDVVAPNAFREAVELFHKWPRADVIYGNGYAIDQNGHRIRRLYSAKRYSARLAARGLAVIVQQSAFMKTRSLIAVGGFPVENRSCWDGEAFFEMARQGQRFRRVWRDWGYFRIYPQSISGGGAFLDRIRIVHDSMRARVGLDAASADKVKRFLIWTFLRLEDVRRWPSYLLGPIRPHKMS